MIAFIAGAAVGGLFGFIITCLIVCMRFEDFEDDDKHK